MMLLKIIFISICRVLMNMNLILCTTGLEEVYMHCLVSDILNKLRFHMYAEEGPSLISCERCKCGT